MKWSVQYNDETNEWVRTMNTFYRYLLIYFSTSIEKRKTKQEKNSSTAVWYCARILLTLLHFFFPKEIKEISHRTDENGWKWEKRRGKICSSTSSTPSTLTSSVSFQAFMRLTREIEEKTTIHITLSLSP